MIILGDLHGDWHLRYTMGKEGIRNANIIQVGDMGLGFYDLKSDMINMFKLNDLMMERNTHMYIIRGNHDNPKFWNEELLNDLPNIHLIKDNTLLEMEDKKILFIGGGVSIDRKARTVGVNYWKDEGVDIDYNFIKSIESVDYVVTHIAPSFVFPKKYNELVYSWLSADNELDMDLKYERGLMDTVHGMLKDKGLKSWFYGHYHRNNVETINGVTYVCVGIQQWFTEKNNEFLILE